MKRLLFCIFVLILVTCAFAPLSLAEPAEASVTPTPEPPPAAAMAEPVAPIADAEDGGAPLVRLTVETVSAEPAGEVQVALLIDNGNGVDSLECNLNFNSAALKVLSVTPGVTFPAEYCITNTNEVGRVRLAAACAFGLDNESGAVILLKCRLLGETGSAITLSDVRVTTVGAEYVQSKAYVEIVDGGVTVGGTLPPVAITPWIPETPVPPETPTPAPTDVPAITLPDTPAPVETPAPAPPEDAPSPLPYIIAGVIAVLIAAGIVILLVSSGNRKKRRRKNGRKKRSPSAKSRE